MDNLNKTHEQWKLDLQLFADDADVDNNDVEDEGPEAKELLDKPIVRRNEDGEYEIDFGDAEDEQNGDDQEPEPEPEEQEEPREEQEEKFTVQTEDGEVEVTLQELKDGYLRRANYTKKTQELAEQRKSLKQEAPSNVGNLPRELEGADKIDLANFEVVQDFLKQKAIEQVKSKLKLDEFYEDDLKHISAYMDIRNDLAMKLNGVVKTQERMNTFANELKAEDSRFEEIWRYIGQKREELPYKIVAAMDKALVEADTVTLRRVYQEFRKDFYAEKVTKTPTQKAPLKQTKVAQPIKSEPPKSQSKNKNTLDFSPQDLADMNIDQQISAVLQLAALEDE